MCTIGGTSVCAHTPTNADKKEDVVATLPASPEPAKKEAGPKKELLPDEKLRDSLGKLVADTKAGNRKLPGPSQLNPARNNLSKGKKIAIGVGIAAAVVLVVVVIHAKNHLFDGFNLSNNH